MTHGTIHGIIPPTHGTTTPGTAGDGDGEAGDGTTGTDPIITADGITDGTAGTADGIMDGMEVVGIMDRTITPIITAMDEILHTARRRDTQVRAHHRATTIL